MWRWMEEIHRNLHISGFNHRYLGPCLNTGSFRTSSKVVTCCYWTDVERGNVKMNHMLFHGVKQVDLWKWFGHVIQQYVYIVLMSIWKHKSSISSVYVPKTTEKNHTNISWHDVFFPTSLSLAGLKTWHGPGHPWPKPPSLLPNPRQPTALAVDIPLANSPLARLPRNFWEAKDPSGVFVWVFLL